MDSHSRWWFLIVVGEHRQCRCCVFFDNSAVAMRDALLRRAVRVEQYGASPMVVAKRMPLRGAA
jgi:hypothetical protein